MPHLKMDCDRYIPALRVIRELDRIAQTRGYAEKLRLDNGPEFILETLSEWAKAHGIKNEKIFWKP